MFNFIETHYKKIVLIMLAFMAVVSMKNAWNESAIFDETAHISAAYTYVSQKEMRLNPEHPPLIKDLSGLPLLFMDLNFDVTQPFWTGTLNGKWDEGQWKAGHHLLYEAGNDADVILFWARFPIIVVSILLGLFIFKWVREIAGTNAGIFALALYAFDPNILGHNHFVTTDLGIAAFLVFAFYYYFKFLKNPVWKNILIAGLFLGFLQLTKFSSIVAFPIIGLATLIFPLALPYHGEKNKLLHKLKGMGEYIAKGVAVFAISIVVVWSLYYVNTLNMTQETIARTIEANFPSEKTDNPNYVLANNVLHKLNGNAISRPLAEYGLGMSYVFRRVAGGNGAYFMGEVSSTAFPEYFPTVFLLKEPLITIFLMLSAILLTIFNCFRHCSAIRSAKKLFSDSLEFVRHHIAEISMFGFIALYSYISVTGNLNIGFRHLFPILPFALMLTTIVLFRFYKTLRTPQKKTIVSWLLLTCAIFLISGTLRHYPYYMSYFNQVAGGPKHGHRFATDSNADWGQDLKRLKNWTSTHNEKIDKGEVSCIAVIPPPSACVKIDKIRINYFGGGSIKYYFGDMAIDWWPSRKPIEPGWYAISVNHLMGNIYDKNVKYEDSYRWLIDKKIQPVAQVGTSIFVYYITTDQISIAD